MMIKITTALLSAPSFRSTIYDLLTISAAFNSSSLKKEDLFTDLFCYF